jgi:hypothetical protein
LPRNPCAQIPVSGERDLREISGAERRSRFTLLHPGMNNLPWAIFFFQFLNEHLKCDKNDLGVIFGRPLGNFYQKSIEAGCLKILGQS